ncbi:MAG: T9SS type A sorting domain-containing protein [Bacteroidia bacterium]
MKRIYTIIISVLLLTNFAKAQNFTVNPKSGKAQGSSLKDKVEVIVTFTNNAMDATDTAFAWEVIEANMPSTWSSQICDPFTCLEGSGKLGFKSNFIKSNVVGNNTGSFVLDFFSNGNQGLGLLKVLIKSVKTGHSDTITAEGKVWTVAVKEAKQNKEFSFYPNPAKDELYLKYFSKESFQVEIYNILRSKVKTFTLNGGQANVNIEELSNGIYFLRFKDDEKVISKTFTKN